jgi:putative transposase
MRGKDDILVKAKPLLGMVNTSWKYFLAFEVEQLEMEWFGKHERTGQPLGTDSFVEK